jgi:hypothetical protein
MALTGTDASKRRLVLAAVGSYGLISAAEAVTSAPADVEDWKDPRCGCCKGWVAHMEANGFRSKVHDSGNKAAHTRLGIARKYRACHKAQAGGYAIEGHVPARDVLQLLKNKPLAISLAVAGMPVGSPGMDGGTYDGRKDSYDVALLARDASASLYRRYEASKEGSAP